MYNNNSIFEKVHLLQTNGTATGAPNSCSYADLAVSPIDDAILKSKNKHLHYYGRYRDDCFTVWTGTEEELNEFFEFINTLSPDLKFTMEVGRNVLCFLDLKISIVDGKLETTVYSKPTDSHLYLHQQSCHNLSSIKGIRKGVALRLRRICSTNEEYDKKASEYIQYLVERGHVEDEVRLVFQEVRKCSRVDARKKRVSSSSDATIVFATSYNPRGPNVKGIVKRHAGLLYNDPILKDLYPKDSILVANRRESNLKDLLTRADPYNLKSDLVSGSGGYSCCDKSCESCQKWVVCSPFVECFATGRRFKVRRELNCETPNVVYVAFCLHCGKQGVGSTIAWKARLSNYKSHIKKRLGTCRIAKHFIDGCENPAVENLRFLLVDCLDNTGDLRKEEIDKLLLQKEKFWIGTLVTQHKGLNGSHDWNRGQRWDKEK